MKEIPFTKFQILSADDIMQLGSFKVTYRGRLMLICIAPMTPYAIEAGEHIATLSNAAKGDIDANKEN